jgi:four helix bundle protein
MCPVHCMTTKHFTELRCWQLADRLRTEAIAICAIPGVARDVRFCSSLKDAAGSVCRNLAEGYARYVSGDIVRFFTIALASLAEVQDHLKEAHGQSFVNQELFDRVWDLSEHTKATTINFMKPHERKVAMAKRRPPRV